MLTSCVCFWLCLQHTAAYCEQCLLVVYAFGCVYIVLQFAVGIVYRWCMLLVVFSSYCSFLLALCELCLPVVYALGCVFIILQLAVCSV